MEVQILAFDFINGSFYSAFDCALASALKRLGNTIDVECQVLRVRIKDEFYTIEGGYYDFQYYKDMVKAREANFSSKVIRKLTLT